VYLGKFRLPDLVEKNRELGKTLLEVHEVLGWILVGLVVIHVLAALKHHFIDKDATLRRMTSWRAS
jgi:cytochrome b561